MQAREMIWKAQDADCASQNQQEAATNNAACEHGA
jgi:hypothetical protein